MEDIICPQCGRPNLIEAEKCWYCQISLQDIKSSEIENHSTDSIKGKLSSDEEVIPNSIEEAEQEIPEWLKRIRELKEADQPPEENDPSWQQQDLFNNENKVGKSKSSNTKKSASSKKISRKNINKEKKNDNPAELPEGKPYVFHRKINADVQEKPGTESTNQEDDALSHDLPEGFTKI